MTAWVVEWVTGRWLRRATAAATSTTAATTPSATPLGARWLVGTTAWASTRPDGTSTATALVKVPPTSTPTRTVGNGIVHAAVAAVVRRAEASVDAPIGRSDERVQRTASVHARPGRAGRRRSAASASSRWPGTGRSAAAASPLELVVGDEVGGLQRVHGVAEEGDRGGHDQTDGDVHERAHRQPATEAEDGPRHHDERGDAEQQPEQDVATEPGPERPQRLVEERRLEALPVHRREPDQDQRGHRTERHRAPQPGLHELHPALVLEPRHQPERHVDEHGDGDQGGDGLDHLEADRQDREQPAHGEHGERRGDGGQPDADQDRLDELGRAGRFEVAEQDRDQEHDLEALAEDDDERLARHQRRGGRARPSSGVAHSRRSACAARPAMSAPSRPRTRRGSAGGSRRTSPRRGS